MTDAIAALSILSHLKMRDEVLADFYARWQDEPLVLDKWFAVQASAQRSDAIEQVEKLSAHPQFTPANPNRLRSIAIAFGMNQWAFNQADGRGYRFLADLILKADKLNPQVAARLVTPFGRWRRFDEKRSGMMRAELERMLATPGLSKDLYEQVSKSLA